MPLRRKYKRAGGRSADPALVDSAQLVTRTLYSATDLTGRYFEGNGQENTGPSASVGIPNRMFKDRLFLKHQINASDTVVWNGFRTECTMADPTGATQYCVPYRTPLIWGAAFKFLSFTPNGGDFLVSQWHNGDSDMINPSMSLCVLSDRWTLVRRWDPNVTTTNPSPFENYDLGPVVTDVWEHFVNQVCFDWALAGCGYTRLWRNGQRVVNVDGPNSANDVQQKFHKHGFYQWDDPGFLNGVNRREMLTAGDFFYLASSRVTPHSMLRWLRSITHTDTIYAAGQSSGDFFSEASIVSYIWASRPSAAGNSGSIICVTDIGPSSSLWISDGTNWNPLHPVCVYRNATTVDGSLSASAQALLAMGPIPVGILISGRRYDTYMSYGKNGTTDQMTNVTLRQGTAGTTGDTALLTGIGTLTAAQQSTGVMVAKRMASATSTTVSGNGNGNSFPWGGAGAASNSALATATTVSDVTAAAQYLTLCVTMNGTTNKPQAGVCEIWVLP